MCCIVAVVFGLLLVAAAPAAHATVTNLIATNESGEPLDESITTLTANENLWAYVTSPSGAIICAYSQDADAGADCDGGWGETAAPPFFAGPMPVTGAWLKPGVWRLIAVHQLGLFGAGNVEAMSQPFRVLPCSDDCSVSQPDPTYAKQVFSSIR